MAEIKCYSTKNEVKRGREKILRNGRTRTLSIELEMSKENHEILDYLEEQEKYIATYDSSVEVECKSPIFFSKALLKKSLKNLFDKFEFDSWMFSRYFDETTGCHINIGGSMITQKAMKAIRENQFQLFAPLSFFLRLNDSVAEELFGRSMNRYAQDITGYGKERNNEKYNYINTLHEEWLEFRLCKINNYKQFARCIDLCICITEIVEDKFLSGQLSATDTGMFILDFVKKFAEGYKIDLSNVKEKATVYSQKVKYKDYNTNDIVYVDWSKVSWAWWSKSEYDMKNYYSFRKHIVRNDKEYDACGVELIKKEITYDSIIRKSYDRLYLKNRLSWMDYLGREDELINETDNFIIKQYTLLLLNFNCELELDKQLLIAWQKELYRRFNVEELADEEEFLDVYADDRVR